MDKFELFSANHFLCWFPENLSFENLLQLILKNDDSVERWQPFERVSADELCDFLCDMSAALRNEFGD